MECARPRAVTPDTIPGRVPTPSVVFGDGQLHGQLAGPANEGSRAHRLRGRDRRRANSVIARGTATTYVWDGLTNGTNYQFRIVADERRRAAPTRRRGPTRSTRCGSPTRPARPAVQRGNRFLDLTWTPSPNNGDPVIEYQVRMQSNPNVWVPVGSGTTYRWSDLPNGVVQQFQVRCAQPGPRLERRVSGWSAPVKPCAVPDQPGRTVRGPRRRPAVVTYTAPGDQGCAISQIQIEASGGAHASTAAGSPYTFTGLTQRHVVHVPGPGA